MDARAQIHRLVDALPDDKLATVERMLAETAVAPAKAPTEARSSVVAADAAEKRLHGFFRRFKGRSLADELIAERREEARRAPS